MASVALLLNVVYVVYVVYVVSGAGQHLQKITRMTMSLWLQASVGFYINNKKGSLVMS